MSITKIHLFSKNTDAVASMRGYEFQKLKTLEAWLEASVNKTDEKIYCEYEEDIFQRNEKSQTSRFRQLKLYSTNFSFASEEIRKAIIHFFDLYTKGDYLFDDVSFIFEANSSVAASYADNDAELLRHWHGSQDKMDEELKQNCAGKVKNIVDGYFSSEYARAEKDSKLTQEIEEGYKFFKDLKEDDWKAFVSKIKWVFGGLPVEEAVSQVNNNIRSLILRLSHPIDKEALSSIMGVLYLAVSDRAIQDLPENRVLDAGLLDKLVLEHGSEEERWYIAQYEKWSKLPEIEYFSIGEFYEIVDATQHCRRSRNVWKHIQLWKLHLESYCALDGVPLGFKRKALYEVAWLCLKSDSETFQPEGSLNEVDDRLRLYFEQMTDFRSFQDLDEALNLINLVNGSSSIKRSSFTKEEIDLVIIEFHKILSEELENAADNHRICHVLELIGFLDLTLRSKITGESPEDVVRTWYRIVPLLDEAILFNVTQLSQRINGLMQMLIHINYTKHEKVVTELDKFSEELLPYVQKRDGDYKSAKNYVDKGVAFLTSKHKTAILKGLDYLHKAKQQFLMAETLEGYVLATLNISQFYSATGLNLAGKYYALTALWMSIFNRPAPILKRIPQSFAMLQHIDFKQGAWMNSITNFSQFLRTKQEFDNTEFDLEKDSVQPKMFSEMAFVALGMTYLAPHMAAFVNHTVESWGEGAEEVFALFSDPLAKEVKTADAINSLIEVKTDDFPLNDLGRRRTVRWNALGTLWQIEFENSSVGNSVGEEFCAMFQIFQGEISLLNADFHLLRSHVKIVISIGDNFRQPALGGTNEEPEYTIELPVLGDENMKAINAHNKQISKALLYILSEISLLKLDEATKSYIELFEKQRLSEKSYTVNSYQVLYRSFYNDQLFEIDQRASFSPVPKNFKLPHQYSALSWKDDTSAKYNEALVKDRIKERYAGAYLAVHLTIEKLKNDREFKQIIQKYRTEGWLDWQISLAIANFVMNHKCRDRLKGIENQPEYIDGFAKCMAELVRTDEKDCYIEFSPSDFESFAFKAQLEQIPLIVLKFFGLESRTTRPNFQAMREFLNKRFKFNIDDVEEGNFLKEV